MSYNLDMETALAASWKREVDVELDEVRTLLTKVSEECKTVAGEEDTLMQTVYDVGTQLSTNWDKLNNRFVEVQNYCTEIINTSIKAGETSMEMIEQYLNRVRNR